MATAPKVFISHASEDKARFVLEFATRLRQHGVDAWLDRWEMLPGDSLVDKIFEEGLKEAVAVIVVLSQTSVKKKWVREELNASVVARISRGTRIIPIVLDDCAVPESLASTLWVKVDDLANYDDSFQHIMDAVLGRSTKPRLGLLPDGPSEAQDPEMAVTTWRQLEKDDQTILTAACDDVLQESTGDSRSSALMVEIGIEKFRRSASFLAEQGLVRVREASRMYQVSITPAGAVLVLEVRDEQGFRERCSNLVKALPRGNAMKSLGTIATEAGVPLIVAHLIVQNWRDKGCLQLQGDYPVERMRVSNVTERFLRSQRKIV